LAATPADKPVVTVGRLDVHDDGGASPDTWYTKVTVPVGGSNFTPGGDVYVRFQDLTAGTPAVAGEWITAGTGPCGFEGQQLRQDLLQPVPHLRLPLRLRPLATHMGVGPAEEPQSGYGWSSSDVQVTCS